MVYAANHDTNWKKQLSDKAAGRGGGVDRVGMITLNGGGRSVSGVVGFAGIFIYRAGTVGLSLGLVYSRVRVRVWGRGRSQIWGLSRV